MAVGSRSCIGPSGFRPKLIITRPASFARPLCHLGKANHGPTMSPGHHPGYSNLEPLTGNLAEALRNISCAKERYSVWELCPPGRAAARRELCPGSDVPRRLRQGRRVPWTLPSTATTRLKHDFAHLGCPDLRLCAGPTVRDRRRGAEPGRDHLGPPGGTRPSDRRCLPARCPMWSNPARRALANIE